MYHRLGRVSVGYMAVKMENGEPVRRRDNSLVTFPRRSDSFVFHTDDRARADEIARVYGGEVAEAVSSDEEGGTWRVITNAREIECILPATDERGFDDWMETWGRGGLIRRCNGSVCLIAVDPETGEIKRDVPCVCDALDLKGDDRCDPTTRLNVLMPGLSEAPGLGIWQVQSRGWATHNAIASAIDLMTQVGVTAGVPIVLRIEQRTMRSESEDGKAKAHSVPVITLDSRLSFAQVLRQRGEIRGMLPGPDRDPPPLGATITEEQQAENRASVAKEEQERDGLYQRLLANFEAIGVAATATATQPYVLAITGKESRKLFTLEDWRTMVRVTDRMVKDKLSLDEAMRADAAEQTGLPT